MLGGLAASILGSDAQAHWVESPWWAPSTSVYNFTHWSGPNNLTARPSSTYVAHTSSGTRVGNVRTRNDSYSLNEWLNVWAGCQNGSNLQSQGAVVAPRTWRYSPSCYDQASWVFEGAVDISE